MELELLIDGHHGIYIPQIFAQQYGEKLIKQQPNLAEDFHILDCGPDTSHESDMYWEAWETILDGIYTDDSGKLFSLYQSGDLWLVPDGYEGEYPE